MSKDKSLLEEDLSSLAPLARACADCPLRRRDCFHPATAQELQFIDSLKQAEIGREAGSTLIAEGANEAPLYTLLSGWAFRFKTLPDGRRQILTLLLPGDFIGLQQRLEAAASHGVEALTDVRLCVFPRDALWQLHRELPSLGYDVTWLAAHHESLVDDNLLSVGRRNAAERIAALLLTLTLRATALDEQVLAQGLPFPLTQVHVADALGLSLVHTNRQLRALERNGLVVWRPQSRLHLPDPAALARVAKLRWPLQLGPRPLI
jgi:CRP/FNR family transcriptional regulator